MKAITKAILPLMAMAMAQEVNEFAQTSRFEPNENIKVSLSRKPGKSKFKPNQFKKRKGRSK